MVSNISQGPGSSLFDMLRTMQKGQKATLEKSLNMTAQTLAATSPLLMQTHAASPNLMSHNFTSAERGESRYTQARIQGLQVNRQMNGSKQNTLMSIMQQAKMEYENAEFSGEKYKALRRAENKIFWHQRDEVSKSAEETYLKESKKTLEDKVEEAMASKDKNGDPIETGGTEVTVEAAPMPEIPGSTPAPVPTTEVSAATNPDVAAVAASTPEVPAPSAPAIQSINITV